MAALATHRKPGYGFYQLIMARGPGVFSLQYSEEKSIIAIFAA
jgi:hypothetical protein